MPDITATAKSKLKKNVLFNSLSFVIISGVNFLTIPFIVAKMNLEVFGVYSLLTGLFGYFGIFDFGLGQGLIKFVSEYYANHELKKISLAINSCLLFQIVTGLILVSALYIFSDNIVHLFNVSDQYYSISIKAFKISLIGLFVSFVSSVFSSVLMGLQRYDLTSSVDSVINFLLNISLVSMLSFIKMNLFQAVLVSVLFTGATLLVYIILVRKHIPFYHPTFQMNLGIIKNFIRYSFNIFLSKVSGLFSNHFVRFILSYFLTPSAVTFYVVPSKLLTAVNGMLSNGASTIFPYISSLHARQNMDEIKRSFLKATSLFAGISIPTLLFVALYSNQILSFWMGVDFAEKTWQLLSIITISSLIGSLSSVPNLVILGMGNSRLIAFFSIISIILYVVFLPVLTARFGLIGCGVALLIASVISIIFVFKYTLKFIQMNIKEYFEFTYGQHFLPAMLLILITLFLKLSLPITNIYLLIIGGILVSFYYYILYQKVYLRLNKQIIK